MAKNQKKTKEVEVDKPKALRTKKNGTYSDFTNISDKANPSTQTVSNKKLLKPILHSIGLTLGKSDPINNNSANDSIKNKIKQRMAA